MSKENFMIRHSLFDIRYSFLKIPNAFGYGFVFLAAEVAFRRS